MSFIRQDGRLGHGQLPHQNGGRLCERTASLDEYLFGTVGSQSVHALPTILPVIQDAIHLLGHGPSECKEDVNFQSHHILILLVDSLEFLAVHMARQSVHVSSLHLSALLIGFKNAISPISITNGIGSAALDRILAAPAGHGRIHRFGIVGLAKECLILQAFGEGSAQGGISLLLFEQSLDRVGLSLFELRQFGGGKPASFPFFIGHVASAFTVTVRDGVEGYPFDWFITQIVSRSNGVSGCFVGI
mmetsp:Transcript_19184/g.44775  ORF Transcript_19184/g.44775 Transcript_19184/m.44775 type:complete len:246 (+) Transcript_19184:124-861(+)